MATYDQQGNPVSVSDAVFETSTPGIIKAVAPKGGPYPAFTMAVASRDADTDWAYGPTQSALMMGKVLAAVDTIMDTPDRLSETFKNMGVSGGNWLLIGAVVFIALQVFGRGR